MAMSRKTGEQHHRAVLTDGEVELLRREYERGGWSYAALAAKFEVAKSTVQDIVTFRRRPYA